MDGSNGSSNTPVFVLVIIVLIALSAFFSASETALSSYNKAKMKVQFQMR